MADPLFRADQWNRRYEPRIAPINEYVDRISEPLWLPYVAPIQGGIDAQVLTVLRDPGPGAAQTGGSRFLSTENDDPTVERQGRLLAEAGIASWEVLPRNVRAARIEHQQASIKQVAETLEISDGISRDSAI